MSILPSRQSRRIRPYITALEAQRATEDRRFRQFAETTTVRAVEVSR
ncbi:hypothetical protein [Nocardiopsis rhodophaea]